MSDMLWGIVYAIIFMGVIYGLSNNCPEPGWEERKWRRK